MPASPIRAGRSACATAAARKASTMSTTSLSSPFGTTIRPLAPSPKPVARHTNRNPYGCPSFPWRIHHAAVSQFHLTQPLVHSLPVDEVGTAQASEPAYDIMDAETVGADLGDQMRRDQFVEHAADPTRGRLHGRGRMVDAH